MDNTPISKVINKWPKKKPVKNPMEEVEHKVKESKKQTDLNTIVAIWNLPKVNRTRYENTILTNYLSTNFDYFKKIKESDDIAKLKKVVSVLNVEQFEANDDILRFGEEGDRFYILLDGKVGIYKPVYEQKLMKLRDYLTWLTRIQSIGNDTWKYNRIIEKNLNLNLDMQNWFQMNPYSYSMRQTMKFFIEEEQKLGEFETGFAFGEIALLKRCKRNATIKALKRSLLLFIDKSDYNKIMRELDEKKLDKEWKEFQRKYPLFQYWNPPQLISLFNCFSKVRLSKGDYLFKQNDESDYIYIIESGKIELYSLLSFGWWNDFFLYLISAKNNWIQLIYNQPRFWKDTELQVWYEDILKQKEKSPCLYDPLKVGKIITSVEKKESLAKIKQEEEDVIDPFNWFKVHIKTINTIDVIGIEDSWELKNRFYFAKVASPTADVLKVGLFDFLRLMNYGRQATGKLTMMNIIAKKKAILYKQIWMNVKNKENNIESIIDYHYEQFLEEEGADEKMKMVTLKWRNKDKYEYRSSPITSGFNANNKKVKLKELRIVNNKWNNTEYLSKFGTKQQKTTVKMKSKWNTSLSQGALLPCINGNPSLTSANHKSKHFNNISSWGSIINNTTNISTFNNNNNNNNNNTHKKMTISNDPTVKVLSLHKNPKYHLNLSTSNSNIIPNCSENNFTSINTLLSPLNNTWHNLPNPSQLNHIKNRKLTYRLDKKPDLRFENLPRKLNNIRNVSVDINANKNVNLTARNSCWNIFETSRKDFEGAFNHITNKNFYCMKDFGKFLWKEEKLQKSNLPVNSSNLVSTIK